ncbi:MAG: hypothetical protein H0W43_00135 [Chthoniobacterales bacterium]|nr:hypothetical protein [Chthoniobacterales bacterium]
MPTGFSLVEVVVAIGIVSFAVLSVFGLLSVATDTNRRSREEQSCAQLVQNEFQRIRSLSSVNFPMTTYVTRYYDAGLNDLGTSISGNAIYQLQIAITPHPTPFPTPTPTPMPAGWAQMLYNAEVRYPANAPAANQKAVRFTALMNNPP